MPDIVVLLGWGSLLWDPRREFDEQHGPWNNEGPTLPLEFSRISTTRAGALTLVIDPEHGQPCRVAYAISKRADFRDAVCDLRSREGTLLDRIGCLRIGDAIPASDRIRSALSEWGAAAGIHVVVWTALATNFAKEKGMPFSLVSAVAHLHELPSEGKALAAEYVWRAPSFVDTPLRRALQAEPWFSTGAPAHLVAAPILERQLQRHEQRQLPNLCEIGIDPRQEKKLPRSAKLHANGEGE